MSDAYRTPGDNGPEPPWFKTTVKYIRKLPGYVPNWVEAVTLIWLVMLITSGACVFIYSCVSSRNIEEQRKYNEKIEKFSQPTECRDMVPVNGLCPNPLHRMTGNNAIMCICDRDNK